MRQESITRHTPIHPHHHTTIAHTKIAYQNICQNIHLRSWGQFVCLHVRMRTAITSKTNDVDFKIAAAGSKSIQEFPLNLFYSIEF